MNRGKIHFINCNSGEKTACGISVILKATTRSFFPEDVNCKRCKRTKLYLELKKEEKEFIHGNPKAKVNYKIVGITDSKKED